MPERTWARYALAVLSVAAATALTAAIPILRDRLTFFAFWPLTFLISWFAGVGPGLVATVSSALAVLFVLPAFAQTAAGGPDLTVTVGVFCVAGVLGAFLARWREQTEAALRESSERFTTLTDSAPVLIWMSGLDRRRNYFNRPWLQFTGRRLEDQLGEGWLESIHPDDRERCMQTYIEAFDARRPVQSQYRIRRHDGVYRYVLSSKAPRYGQDGAFLGFVGSCVDVTEQLDAIHLAETARAEAEAANRAKDAFLATVSHELRTPLSPILSWVRMLRDGALDPVQVQRALEVIERNARMQAQLIEDLLDVSRIVEGKLRLHVRPVALAGIVENAVETVRAAADAKEIRLQVVLDSGAAMVAGDPDRLQQIVWNLLSNAVKFTPKGGRVQIVLERVNSHVELSVADTGAGLSRAQLPHLFERFWQGDASPTRVHGGLGLGLAIVRHLVELHGGTVTAESGGEGQGSTFTVTLPLAPIARKTDDPVRRHPTMHEAAVPSSSRLDGLRVLLVDDDPDSNEAVRLLLVQSGADVRVAASASQALEILNRWTPDVLVSDIGMPVEDGYALLAKVRARADERGRIPAIALTAYAAVEDRVRLLSAGFQMHVAKPADPGELTAAIATVHGGVRAGE